MKMSKLYLQESDEELITRVGMNLKIIRELKNYTQKYVADKIGCTYQTYNSYENGKREIGVVKLMKLAQLYDVSVDFLLNKTPTTEDEAREMISIAIQEIEDMGNMKEKALEDNLPIEKLLLFSRGCDYFNSLSDKLSVLQEKTPKQ